MKPFATVDDLAAIYPGYSPENAPMAKRLLALVSSAIASMCDAPSIDAGVLTLVTCQCVGRMMQAGASGGLGVSQESWTASPYGGSTSYANPSGDIYLTKFEKGLLGVDDGWAGYVQV